MPNKFFAKHFIDDDGIKWDSKREYREWLELRESQDLGIISYLERQVKFELLPSHKTLMDSKTELGVKYTCDFVFIQDGTLYIEDIKSEYTRKEKDYVLRRKMFKYFYLNKNDKGYEKLHKKFPKLKFENAQFIEEM